MPPAGAPTALKPKQLSTILLTSTYIFANVNENPYAKTHRRPEAVMTCS